MRAYGHPVLLVALFLAGIVPAGAAARTRVRTPARAAASPTGRPQDRAFTQQVKPLSVPVRGKLFHQVDPTYSRPLERAVQRKFQAWPAIWKERGDLIWTSQGRRYFEYSDKAAQMGVFLLRPRRGWRFVAREQLELDPETNNPLHTFWLEQVQAAGKPLPRNRFSRQLQGQLRAEGLPDHSDFYERYRIAGFRQDDYRGTPKSSFVFVHELGGEVRLLSPAHR